MLQRWNPGLGVRPWRPFGIMDEMERVMDSMLRQPSLFKGEGEMVWAPALEVYEKDDKFIIKAELPGMKKEDIKVSVTEDTLAIEGERKFETEANEENYYRREMSYGDFSRRLVLPATVDKTKIDAKYTDGILELSLPKIPEPKPQQVEIKVK